VALRHERDQHDMIVGSGHDDRIRDCGGARDGRVRKCKAPMPAGLLVWFARNIWIRALIVYHGRTPSRTRKSFMFRRTMNLLVINRSYILLSCRSIRVTNYYCTSVSEIILWKSGDLVSIKN
jgi:hypothetical protein